MAQNKPQSKNNKSEAPASKPATQSTAPQPAPQPAAPAAHYRNCAQAKTAGVAPLRAGQPGYGSHLDRDGGGIACEK